MLSKYSLEGKEATAVNGAMKNLEYPFKDAEVGVWTASGGQCAVYELNTKSGDEKYVIKISEESFDRITKFNDEFIDYCKELKKKNGEENISELYLKNERHFFVPGENSQKNLYCIIEKHHLCLGNYEADGLNPRKNDMEIAIRLGADLLRLLDVMGNMKNPFVHRDIKPSNIFFKTKNLADGFCLGDFGIATQLLDGTMKTQIKDLGTVQTASPDIFLHDKYHSLFSGAKKADMYSLAVTMYYYLNDREYPFVDRKTSEGILDHQYWEDIRKKGCKEPKHGTTELKKIVCKALNFHPDNRYKSCAEMLEELKKTEEYKSFIESAEKKGDTVVIPDHSDFKNSGFKNSLLIKDEDSKNKKKKHRALKSALGIAAASVILAVCALLFVKYPPEIIKDKYYEKAVSFAQSGDDVNAALYYGKAKDYKDAKEKSFALWDKITSVKTVAAGYYQTVNINNDGTVSAVGYNGLGLFDVTEWTDIVTVSANINHTVGLKSDGTVVAVGYKDSGRCDVSKWKDIVDVSAGEFHTVGLKSDGTVVVTGGADLLTDPISGAYFWSNIVAVSAGSDYAVGLKSDGTVVVSGSNDFDQHNAENWTHIISISSTRDHIAGLKSNGTVVAVGRNYDGQCDVSNWTDIVEVSAGYYHTVGLKSNGTVVAVGENEYGQCNVSDWTDIVAVSAGSYHTIGIKSDGTVVAVGKNDDGQCDVDNLRNRYFSDLQKIFSAMRTVSAGNYHTAGLKSDGTVFAVGSNNSGQCDVNGWTDIVAVSSGGYHTLGLKSDGTVVAAGKNDDGQCNNVSGWNGVVDISAGGYHSVGLKFDGTVVAVGDNEYGQCNVGDWKNIISVSAGRFYTVGLKSDGTVVAVGSNSYKQCDLSGWTDIIAVSAGDRHTVGLKSDGTVVAVGDNEYGQCNNLNSWTDIVAIYAGHYHTLGLKSDGTVVAGGRNDDGQCDVADWTDVAAVSAGAYHSAALKSDGTVVAVGCNPDDGRCNTEGWKNIMLP